MDEPTSGEWLTKKEAAEFLRVSPRTLDSWMSDHGVPHYRLHTGAIRFKRAELATFIADSKVDPE